MTALERNAGLMIRMGDFLQAVVAMPATADGTRFLPAGTLERAREMSSDAYFAGEATPVARLVTRMGALIDTIDELPFDRAGNQAMPASLAAQAVELVGTMRAMAA